MFAAEIGFAVVVVVANVAVEPTIVVAYVFGAFHSIDIVPKPNDRASEPGWP